MKRENFLVALVIVLVALIAFETGYLMNAKKNERKLETTKKESVYGASYPASRISRYHSVNAPALPDPFTRNWDPFEEMDQIHKMMNRMINETHNRSKAQGVSGMVFSSFDPDLDVKETNTEYIIRLDLPGIDKDKINVKIDNGVLTVAGERQAEKEEKNEGEGFYRMERSFGSFSRSFPVPADADVDGMKAETKNGVLTVRFPKLAQARPSTEKKVTVQ